MSKRSPRPGQISDSLIETICMRLAANKRVRRTLPRRGRLHVDRQLPFLCVYRRPADADDPGTRDLVKSEASYLISSGDKSQRRGLRRLVERIVEVLGREFGAVMIVEIWAAPDGGASNDPRAPDVSPRFTVVAPNSRALAETVESLAGGLRRIKVLRQSVAVDIEYRAKVTPPGTPPLLSGETLRRLNGSVLGIAVPPVYRDPKTGRDFPLLLRTMRRQLGLALRKAIFQFVNERTTHSPPHYHALGRRAVVKSVWEVDQMLAEVGNTFDFLLQVTPINANEAGRQFAASHYERPPEFHYLPIPMDPAVLKRQLFKIPVEKIEDPALHRLFQEKQEELDRKITMLRDRNTPRFLYGSLQLFGKVTDRLLQVALDILDQVPSRSRDESRRRSVTAAQFARCAEEEFAYYRRQDERFTAKVQVTSRVAGLMVSRGRLLVNDKLNVPASRVYPLLQHEVGTHLLTYFNGFAQPFRQLYSGLAGYDELQEGLAVLAEYLVGGLSRPRLRQLAARVIAAHAVQQGASFVEAFRVLDRTHDFARPAAFTVTMRAYRSGGLTKDAVYLRGLRSMLKYVSGGGSLDPLFIGKMAAEHIPIIRELEFRKVLRPPLLRPRYMEDPQAQRRLAQLRGGATVLDLVRPASPVRNESGLHDGDVPGE